MKVRVTLESMSQRETYVVKPQLVNILRWTLQVCEKLDFDDAVEVTRVTQLLIENQARASDNAEESHPPTAKQ